MSNCLLFVILLFISYLAKSDNYMYMAMVFNATFNNISAISLRSVVLVEEPEYGVRREYHRSVAGHWQTLSHNIVSSTPRHGIRTHSVSDAIHWLHR